MNSHGGRMLPLTSQYLSSFHDKAIKCKGQRQCSFDSRLKVITTNNGKKKRNGDQLLIVKSGSHPKDTADISNKSGPLKSEVALTTEQAKSEIALEEKDKTNMGASTPTDTSGNPEDVVQHPSITRVAITKRKAEGLLQSKGSHGVNTVKKRKQKKNTKPYQSQQYQRIRHQDIFA